MPQKLSFLYFSKFYFTYGSTNYRPLSANFSWCLYNLFKYSAKIIIQLDLFSLFFTLAFSNLFFQLLLFISDSILYRFGTRWHSVLLFVENRAIVENKIQGFKWDQFPCKGNLLYKCYKTWISLLLHHDKLFLYNMYSLDNKCHYYIYASH